MRGSWTFLVKYVSLNTYTKHFGSYKLHYVTIYVNANRESTVCVWPCRTTGKDRMKETGWETDG